MQGIATTSLAAEICHFGDALDLSRPGEHTAPSRVPACALAGGVLSFWSFPGVVGEGACAPQSNRIQPNQTNSLGKAAKSMAQIEGYLSPFVG